MHRNERYMAHAHTYKASMYSWNQELHTDREVIANRPYIKNKQEKTFILIDMAIPADRNVTQNEAEKKLKCNS
jgi:hypothetical protein